MNEPLIGNFEGIGIQFNILYDSIIVVEPIFRRTFRKSRIKSRDRIIKINGEQVTGLGYRQTGS
jgi:carboxyl-terminal processing protease